MRRASWRGPGRPCSIRRRAERHTCLGLVLSDIGKIIEDDEVEAIEASDLELLNKLGGPGEWDATSVLDQGKTTGRCEIIEIDAATQQQRVADRPLVMAMRSSQSPRSRGRCRGCCGKFHAVMDTEVLVWSRQIVFRVAVEIAKDA